MHGAAHGLLALVLLAWDGSLDDLPAAILAEVKARPVPCPEKLAPADACGEFSGDFSKFKFELEFEIGMQDFRAERVSAWRLYKGIYLRTWRVRDEPITIGFDPEARLVAVKVGPLADQAAIEAAEKAAQEKAAKKKKADEDEAEPPKKDDEEAPTDGDDEEDDDDGSDEAVRGWS